MPKIVDPGARRRAVAEAVLRVVSRSGLEAASLRNVAEEAGLAIGSVRHYFSDHDEMMIFAMGELTGRIETRVRAHADRILDPAHAAERRSLAEDLLAEFLPLDRERHEEAVLWIAFATAARTRPGLLPRARQLQDGMLGVVTRVLHRSREAGGLPAGLDIATESLRLSALLDGLTLQAVLQPGTLTPDVLRQVLRSHMDSLRAAA
ncbi:TetR/AcrR family transcriptional regulator [Streptomyces hiroshimensis]|uniref:HTH-type transcriptional regulator PksA n=1 Tax=Streptomyces hiroshimensis TaxID=66424 RepID=A0ABQ2YYU6_9ACTN|nr:TetR family transcriptional regulator C-terminal domain-containing protein [Streptomyces hiroshimensis]GGX97427.1 HTH-type transcriptional regulator PksA [Streptomyces hiroshimensis]